MKNIPVRQIKESGFPESFIIQDIETLLSNEDIIQELHRHNYYFVMILEKGAGDHIIDFTPYKISDYSVFFMRPGQVHKLVLKKGSTGYLIEFTGNFYSPREKLAGSVFRKVSHKNHCMVAANRFNKLLSVSKDIYLEYNMKQTGFNEIIKANLGVFFIELVRQSKNPDSLTNDSKEYALQRLDLFLELLEIHFRTKKQVVQYAELMHLTPYQLNAITKKTMGKTCSELIIDQIVLEAKRLLLATTDQINQIAFELGYEDVSYFIRFFKKQAGYSPETFRKNFR
jgi:AraC family transcriptional regulator, transcriptional activator of pobA